MGPWCTQMSVGSWFVMIALWVSVVAFIVWGVGRLFPVPGAHGARALLDSRLASGEIDADSYRSLRAALEQTDTYARRAQP